MTGVRLSDEPRLRPQQTCLVPSRACWTEPSLPPASGLWSLGRMTRVCPPAALSRELPWALSAVGALPEKQVLTSFLTSFSDLLQQSLRCPTRGVWRNSSASSVSGWKRLFQAFGRALGGLAQPSGEGRGPRVGSWRGQERCPSSPRMCHSLD